MVNSLHLLGFSSFTIAKCHLQKHQWQQQRLYFLWLCEWCYDRKKCLLSLCKRHQRD